MQGRQFFPCFPFRKMIFLCRIEGGCRITTAGEDLLMLVSKAFADALHSLLDNPQRLR
jgi:hypothetical protein